MPDLGFRRKDDDDASRPYVVAYTTPNHIITSSRIRADEVRVLPEELVLLYDEDVVAAFKNWISCLAVPDPDQPEA